MHAHDVAETTPESKPRRKRRTAQTHPWYKRYPRDFWMGTRGLSLEEYAAYDIIVDWMYELGGPVPNDDYQISARLGCKSVRVWRRIRPRLFGPEKLFITTLGISNHRVEEELRARKFDECLGEVSPNFQPNLFENVIDFNARRTQSQIQIQKEPIQDDVRVTFENGRVELHGELRAYWLGMFDGDDKGLELGLIQAAGYIDTNGTRPLEARVGVQLSKQLQWKRERANRPAGAPTFTGRRQSKADKAREFSRKAFGGGA